MSKGVIRLLFTIVFSLAFFGSVKAQFTVQHQPPTVLNSSETNQLEFMVPAVNPLDIVDALLFYRNEGDLGYSQMELEYVNGVFVANLTSEYLVGTSFEYYFQLSLANVSQDIFYPDNVPSENPIKVDIVSATNENLLGEAIEQRPQAEGIDYTILSPQPGNGQTPEDALIAIALYYDINQVQPGEFRLYINGMDVTEDADTSAYFISYKPRNLERGNYSITLDYVTDEGALEVTNWNFKIVKKGEASFQSFGPKMMPTGRVELTARNQIISGNPNNAYTARSYITGGYKKFNYRLSGFLTSQESDRLQPQNRLALQMKLGKWWNLEAGHVYPQLSRFTISGRRIYGVNTELHTLWNNFNVQFLYGEIARKVTNIYGTIEREEVFAGDNPVPVDTSYTLTFGEAGRGTFSRKVIGGRVGLGNPKHFQLGIQAMKVEDDTTSLFNITDYSQVMSSPTFLLDNLRIADQQRLANQPDLLQIQGGSPNPKGNLVAGADMKIGISNNKIRFQTETVASALNNNIYGGPMDSLRAADLGFEDIDPKDFDILDQISRIIIINENMSVLPVRVTGITNADSTEAEFFFPTAILGHNSELSLVYPKNNFSLQYRWVGPEFVSLANSTIRKDIAGFTALDRFRLFENQLYVTLGFESLVDNLTNSKEATTTTNSIRSNFSWYPTNIQLPKISFGFRFRERDNGVTRFNPFVSSELEGAAIQNIRIVDGDTLTTATPRLNNTLNVNFSVTQQIPFESSFHDATLSISTLNTTDEVFAYGDVRNNSFSLSVSSRYTQIPLRTQIGMTLNNTESGSGQLDIGIFGMYAGGSYIFMDGKLNVNGRFAFTSNTSTSRMLQVQNTEDDSYLNDYYVLSDTETVSEFSTFVMLAGAEYKLAENHSLVFSSNLTNVSGNNALNDRIVQLRYIYRF